ncbi:dipeptide/oligopeptide/nickel ABC transporter permease/ATP-binding protein [Streptomyces sp. NPDC051018]|uniref:dipeptide/oligopeptide/nickel ABC transporter permease/ATP-binding protein n=1 Tax=Streptomyces sp. NPDC051018 TaxID=3365639 RepID=UPI0037B55FB3
MPRQRTKWLAATRSPVGACSAALLVLIAVLAVAAPLVWGDAAGATDTSAMEQGPSGEHPLGTDSLGRDIFLRVLVATRLSLGLALAATLIGLVVGVLLGAAPSILPRRAGRLVTAAVNIAVAFPALLLALFLAVIFGVGLTGAVLAIGIAGAPSFARLTQTLAASVAGRDFVAAAKVAGVGRVRMLVRHILPNIGEPLVVNATIGAGNALLAFAGLSFLGIGIQAPDYDWGRLLGEGLDRIYTNPASALAPGAAVVIAGLAFNLFGEAAAAVVGSRTAAVRGGTSPPVPPRRAPVAPAGGGDNADAGADRDAPVLAVENLRVAFPGPAGPVTPVRGVSFTVHAGEAVGVVGESGSGKSLTALAVSRLIESPGVVTADRLDFLGTPLLSTPERELRALLGTSLSMVFQDPMTSFNPTRRVGRQLAEVSEQHQGLSRRAAFDRAVDRLRAVRVAGAERRARQYPQEYSGGMLQRAMIGMGLMGDPRLVVADEPTTALDVTVQRDVLRLLARVRESSTSALLLISHDLTVVAQTCDRVLVMYAGRVVEDLPASGLKDARHPYTRALLDTVPDMDADRGRPLAVILGRPPEPDQVLEGCAFASRCGFASERCTTETPDLADTPALADTGLTDTPEPGDTSAPIGTPVPTGRGRVHRVACWHPAGGPETSSAVTPSAAAPANEPFGERI